MKNSKVYVVSIGFLCLLIYLLFKIQVISAERTQQKKNITQNEERPNSDLKNREENREKDISINNKASQQEYTKSPVCSEHAEKKVVSQATRKLPKNSNQLTTKQRYNLQNEQSIKKEGWLVYPLNDIDDAPTLKYVPHIDISGSFHSVQVYDLSLEPQFQLIYAYSIPYTDEFPLVSKTDAQRIIENNFISNTYTAEYQKKLVWIEDKFKPFHLFKCINKLNKNSIFCLVNAHTGEIKLHSQKRMNNYNK